MEFSTLIWILVVAIVPLALMLFADAKGMFEDIGGGAFSLEDAAPPSGSSPAASQAERELEIRQLVEAKDHRMQARGEPALDVEAEVARLLAVDSLTDTPPVSGGDAALREEVRGIVIARNDRRVAKGEEPLDIEAEIDRQLREIGA